MSLTDDIRAGAARVAAISQSVRINADAIEAYAATLPADSPPAPDLEGADDETRAAFSLQLNAINFGSGLFPTLPSRPGCPASERGSGELSTPVYPLAPATATRTVVIENHSVEPNVDHLPQGL